ncbi:MAG: VIT domain-containing protein, partial [Planctomycetota bacterium]
MLFRKSLRIGTLCLIAAGLNLAFLGIASLISHGQFGSAPPPAIQSEDLGEPTIVETGIEEVLERDVFENEKEINVDEPPIEDPVLNDAEISDHNETDSNEDYESSRGVEDAISGRPFQGKYWNSAIGIGGGAGGAFGGRFGGRRNLRAFGGGAPPPNAAQNLRHKGDKGARVSGDRARSGWGAFGTKRGPGLWSRSSKRSSFAKVSVGGGKTLDLVEMEVRVTVEGHRARTVVDHVFRNPHNRQLEGTFTYPLPGGASLCGYAMYVGTQPGQVPRFRQKNGSLPPLPETMAASALAPLIPAEDNKWGTLRQARVVKRAKARSSFEEITRRRIDPALLEKAEGNVFRGRVFPIPAKGANRILIAYEETLPFETDRLVYRFPLPAVSLQHLGFSLFARRSDMSEEGFEPEASRWERAGLIAYQAAWEKEGPGGEVVFSFV